MHRLIFTGSGGDIMMRHNYPPALTEKFLNFTLKRLLGVESTGLHFQCNNSYTPILVEN